MTACSTMSVSVNSSCLGKDFSQSSAFTVLGLNLYVFGVFTFPPPETIIPDVYTNVNTFVVAGRFFLSWSFQVFAHL